jgi:hypothetical protein
VPSPGLPTRRLSRFGVFCPAGTHRLDLRPCGFLDASRLHFFSLALQAPPGGSFVAGFASRRRTGPAGSFSRPGRARWSRVRRRSWGSLFPSQLLSCPRVSDVFPRLGPTCRLVRSTAASVFARGCRDKPSRRCWRRDVRLLGFGPAGRPFPAVHRPRYSFCAEGRRDARAVAALGLGSSFRSSESPAAGLHLWSLSAWASHGCCPWALWGAGA